MYRLNKGAEDSGLLVDLEYTSEQAWIELVAQGIGMAQTSFVSPHHACRAWMQKGASATAHPVLPTDHFTTASRFYLWLWLVSWSVSTPIRIFNITWEGHALSERRDAFSTGLSAMVKALRAWAPDNTEEVIVQTRIGLANTDQVRTPRETPWTKKLFLSRRIRTNSRGNLDWIFCWRERIYHVT